MKHQILFVLCLFSIVAVGQVKDTTEKKKKYGPKVVIGGDSNLVFRNARTLEEVDELEGDAELKISGYVSTYYAYYDDERTNGEFVQFPTICPRNDMFSLNMAMLSFKYKSDHLRSNLIFHYGDIPQSSWPAEFNLIQEANVGIRLVKRLWLDAGFFKTHVGIESFQPRENITSSMAILSYYEPYYLSGAKLTYNVNSKLSIQANIFNGYNEYLDNNKDKMLGLSMVYSPTQGVNLNYNFITTDETPDKAPVKKRRYYNNFYATFQSNKFFMGLEANYGIQQHSLLSDTTKTASMFSGLVVAKYQFAKKFEIYAREEYFSDPDRILSFDNRIGKYIYGTTAGVEYKPFKNVSISAETRMLQSDNFIFKQGNYNTNTRYEFIACFDLWF